MEKYTVFHTDGYLEYVVVADYFNNYLNPNFMSLVVDVREK